MKQLGKLGGEGATKSSVPDAGSVNEATANNPLRSATHVEQTQAFETWLKAYRQQLEALCQQALRNDPESDDETRR